MNPQRKQGISNKMPITAKNIAKLQENYEKEIKLREKSKTILNGRVKSEHILESDSLCGTDLEYEFLYSVSDDENADHYNYEFDAYPVVPKSPSSALSDRGILESSNELKDPVKKKETDTAKRHSQQQNVSVKPERARSAAVKRSHKQKECLILRPKSASLSSSGKGDVTASKTVVARRKQSSETTKEVAFKDTDSVISKTSSYRSKQNADNKTYRRRKSVSYDPDLEKASAFIHGGGKNFSRSNTSLTPVKYGMKHLQMNYTETNLETNQTVIFLDLLKNSHQKSQIRSDQIRHIERRLEVKRNNPLYSTSFYEHKDIPDPFHRDKKKTIRTVAQKKIERQEKIKQMTDEIHTGYVPTQLTMKIADREEVKDIGKTCRYLRCHAPSDYARNIDD